MKRLINQQVCDFWTKISEYFAYYELFLTIYGLLMYIGIPLYNNYVMGAFEHPPPKNLTYDYPMFVKYPGVTFFSTYRLSPDSNLVTIFILCGYCRKSNNRVVRLTCCWLLR